jgi:repressor LexA|tara:strand:+ start:51392 stop:52075 length:684 start_codon:yes stop_codon:yes gene_type:complete
MLTKKQRDLLLFIHERIDGGDIAPSFDEMRDALGLKSKSGIHRLITALVERGYLERLPNRARALKILKLPENYQKASTSAQVNGAEIIANDDGIFTPSARVEPIPLYGKIAAGTPIEAIRNEGEYFEMPSTMLGKGEFYALRVDGDSMIEAGINDEDIVIIKRTQTAREGTIIVALVDGEEVTLKRLGKENGMVALIPENQAYETRLLEAERVNIQGELVSLYRTYH